jgi:hypothetical protein
MEDNERNEKYFEEDFWKDPEKVMRLLDLLFIGKESPGEFRITS